MISIINFERLNQSTSIGSASSDRISRNRNRSSNSRANKLIKIDSNMQDRGRVINKLALVLISIILLELVLIGDQVQPVKAIKKKIFVKKLKKLLPLLALVKPKKKIILLPIPIPMFKNHGNSYPMNRYRPNQQHHNFNQRPMMIDGSNPPMSFMMMNSNNNNDNTGFGELPLDPFVGVSMVDVGKIPGSMLPMTMTGGGNNFGDSGRIPSGTLGSSNSSQPKLNTNSTIVRESGNSSSQAAATAAPSESIGQMASPTMLMPSMTMTIQSEPGGGSAIELSTNMMSNNGSGLSGALQRRPIYSARLNPSYQHQLQSNDNFEEPNVELIGGGGEQYYSSPWMTQRLPLASPAKVLRNEKLKQLQPQQPSTTSTTTTTPAPQARQAQPQSSRMPSILVIKNQWHPGKDVQTSPEYEELIPIGPPQMMPVYQTANGQLHTSPPDQERGQSGKLRHFTGNSEHEDSSPTSARVNEQNNEVQTVGSHNNNRGLIILDHSEPGNQQMQPNSARTSSRPTEPVFKTQAHQQRLTSPAVKGKQQQQLKSSGY